ncbi:NRAMP family divalent metal transporter [Campylobacter sp. 19-13652]|uniref:NRAMP family divalent metal transporter n=1 Tax=Campylobacter sp. 19-13652 TaxID=2840180 RepID=UPI001C73E56F|nr:NRAMP family divalent metal transporter [Campylobacter sp. 19-13652]BCX79843.1 putative membrane protein [Campylobacter sp. 19-13652]
MADKKAIFGAAALMATSAVGPGFLTQTAKFTETLMASFAFIILASVIIDIGVQLNVWRVIAVSRLKAQELAERVFPGVGYLLAALIVMGGLAFNIGNIAGAGLGVSSVFPSIDPIIGSIISAGVAIAVFASKDAGSHMDKFAQFMGAVMILIIAYTVFEANPPLADAAIEAVAPQKFDAIALVTLVGGTVGGYITFSGAHRLLDAGISGVENLGHVTKSSITGILVASFIRIFLFLAVLGVVATGVKLDPANVALTPFSHILGDFGRIMFGLVIWAASVTSVVGAAYTSVSFMTGFSQSIKRHQNLIIIAFIVFSTLIFSTVGKPVQVLVLVGTLNGLILPIALVVILLAAYRKDIVGTYRHPVWIAGFGWLIAAAMSYLSYITIVKYLSSF